MAQPLGDKVSITPRIRTGIEAAVRGLEIADKLRPALYRLRLAPQLMRGIASGELTMQQAVSGGIRGNVVDSGGKIVGQAAFDVASKGPMLATAAWQLAAQLTAQHFLHEINQRLAGIEKGIGEIKQWLRASWSSDLRGSLAKLHEIASLLVAHDLTDVEVEHSRGAGRDDRPSVPANRARCRDRDGADHRRGARVPWRRGSQAHHANAIGEGGEADGVAHGLRRARAATPPGGLCAGSRSTVAYGSPGEPGRDHRSTRSPSR